MTPTHRALEWVNTVTLSLVARLTSPPREDHDRGDVPGWVMITVMTVTNRSRCLSADFHPRFWHQGRVDGPVAEPGNAVTHSRVASRPAC